MLPLHGRTAVISGGSGGIGLAIARRFARYGANVVITGRSADKIQAALEQLRRDQHARPRAYQVHKGYSFDAGNSTGWEALVKQHVGSFPASNLLQGALTLSW
jgi:NAD(P)-dependent dehydrogenase (short-subunit alcohol dehydrogenase family)